MSLIRNRASQNSRVPMLLLFSARPSTTFCFAMSCSLSRGGGDGFELALALTREPAKRASDYGRRIDTATVTELPAGCRRLPSRCMCGSNPFVEAAADATIASGIAPGLIRTERYGGRPSTAMRYFS